MMRLVLSVLTMCGLAGIACSKDGLTVVATGQPTDTLCCFGNELDGHGRSNVRTMGQIFRVPSTATVLQSFSFWLADPQGDGDGLRFRAYLMNWGTLEGAGRFAGVDIAVGPVLFASAETAGRTSPILKKVTFDVGGLALEAG